MCYVHVPSSHWELRTVDRYTKINRWINFCHPEKWWLMTGSQLIYAKTMETKYTGGQGVTSCRFLDIRAIQGSMSWSWPTPVIPEPAWNLPFLFCFSVASAGGASWNPVCLQHYPWRVLIPFSQLTLIFTSVQHFMLFLYSYHLPNCPFPSPVQPMHRHQGLLIRTALVLKTKQATEPSVAPTC